MGKVSEEITRFAETYSTIITGLHSDLNQYRKEVQKIQHNNTSIEESVLRSYQEIQRLERINFKIASNISVEKEEIKTYHNAIKDAAKNLEMVVKQINGLQDEIGKDRERTNGLQLLLKEADEKIRSHSRSFEIHLIREKENTSQQSLRFQKAEEKIGSLITSQEDLHKEITLTRKQLSNHKLFIIGLFSLFALILILTIFSK